MKNKIVLVNPPVRDYTYGELKKIACNQPFLGILYVASSLEKNGYKVEVIDSDAICLGLEATVKAIIDKNPDFVGITSMTSAMPIIIMLAQKIKEKNPNIKLILGGPHATAVSKLTLEQVNEIDYIVKGEGEITAVELLNALSNEVGAAGLSHINGIAFRDNKGNIIETEDRAFIENLDSISPPAWHLLPDVSYRYYFWMGWDKGIREPSGYIQTSRGCPHMCTFCASKTIWKRRVRFHSPQRVIEEIDSLVKQRKIKILSIQDDTFTLNRARAIEICDRLIQKKYDIAIDCSTRVDAIDEPMLRKMKEAGIKWVAYGVESGNQQVLDTVIKKKINLKRVEEVYKMTARVGLNSIASFVLGMPGENIETCKQTIKFAKKINPDFAAFSILIPLPGCDVWTDSLKAGKALSTDWRLYSAVISKPIQMNDALTPETLLKLRKRAYLEFFLRPSYIIRTLTKFNKRQLFKDVRDALIPALKQF